jgi:hypothetical protein
MMVNERFGYMVGVRGDLLEEVPLNEVAQGQRNIPHDEPLIGAARSVDTCFGDI